MMQTPLRLTTLLCSLEFLTAFVSRYPQQGRLPFQPVSGNDAFAGFRPVIRSTRPLRLSSPLIITFEDNGDGEESEEEAMIKKLLGLTEDFEEDEEDEEELEEDPYESVASSEFVDSGKGGGLVTSTGQVATGMDWGGALTRLRERVDDVESGKSQDPSHALFRLMSSQSPNQAIGSFVQKANPQVVQAMSGAVGSLLGGLAGPQSGVDMIVKASGEKIGSLCFQLQMTGYLFRNAEYILALRDLLKLSGSASLQDYRDAFDRLDSDNSGFIEANEVRDLLHDVYDGKVPDFEIEAFLRFFDQNNDGKVSWDEFERGLGAAMSNQADGRRKSNKSLPLLAGRDDAEDDAPELQPEISGQIEIELEDGRKVKVEAKEYIQSLKDEAQALKDALKREKLGLAAPGGKGTDNVGDFLNGDVQNDADETAYGNIASYIASRQGDVKSLTEGISPEIVNTMKMLVDYVLEGGESRKGVEKPKKEEITMEIPGSALQQLALWQLILGYRLREAEATGDYMKLLE